MKQYLDLAKEVISKGTYKKAAREGMPGTISLFGAQFRHDLSEGFPLLTSKKLSFKNIVFELLWFLRGDTNIKYLIDNGCNIWNEDAYNYYCKKMKELDSKFYNNKIWIPVTFSEFIDLIKAGETESTIPGYTIGDCGKQYGWLWRNWEALTDDGLGNSYPLGENHCGYIDQISDLVKGLKTNPLGRRHILTAWNPATLDDMALNACHALVQFNCRPLTDEEKHEWALKQPASVLYRTNPETNFTEVREEIVPQYYLDCQMYQRSADLFLGVPYNIASYSLLIHIFAKMCNMIPGEFIHTFGDVHIYENHTDQIEEQLSRELRELPTIELAKDIDWENYDINRIWDWGMQLFELKDYNPHPAIKGKLSTGLR